jgi:hypothetical protein
MESHRIDPSQIFRAIWIGATTDDVAYGMRGRAWPAPDDPRIGKPLVFFPDWEEMGVYCTESDLLRLVPREQDHTR